MIRAFTVALALLAASAAAAQNAATIAPGGTLRAAFLAGNPAQAVRDPSTGQYRGASIDLARELAKRLKVPVDLLPAQSPAAVIEGITRGHADIGFIAYAPERTGAVEFSQTYMLVYQTFIVPENSPLKSVADIDKAGLRISGGKGDSVTLYLARNLKQATLVETDNTPADAKKKFASGAIDAFGANRQRLTNMLPDLPGYRLLSDNLFGVPQAIILPKGKSDALTGINAFIDDVRASGFLETAIRNGRIIGVQMAPKDQPPN